MISTAESLAWAAGLFEGEGYITTEQNAKTGGVSLTVGLNNTDLDVLEHFCEVLGVGRVRPVKPHRSTLPHYKPQWIWTVTARTGVETLKRLLPYLGERRTGRATAAIQQYETYLAWATRERVCPICGVQFCPIRKAHGRRRMYCSTTCKERARRERNGRGAPVYRKRRQGLRQRL